jgi:hypothetical protein
MAESEWEIRKDEREKAARQLEAEAAKHEAAAADHEGTLEGEKHRFQAKGLRDLAFSIRNGGGRW